MQDITEEAALIAAEKAAASRKHQEDRKIAARRKEIGIAVADAFDDDDIHAKPTEA
ncbi:hypothetical protein [Paracoccus aminovorans]|uniref:hypothetical protein n=1 Tax=Paracoccus aminovorans TaxID=34004 RepID=UPI002B2585EA|nr:hypothetical protein [Paracoccus aminovorans]